MVLNIVDTVEGWFKPVKDWIVAHGNSWFFWVGVFAIALVIFGAVFAALNKNNR